MPVVTGKIMPAASVTKTDVALVQIFACLKVIVILINKALFTVKLINLGGCGTEKKLKVGTCPNILSRRCNMQSSGCDQRRKKMLFKGSYVILAVEILIIFAKPIIKTVNNIADKLIPFRFAAVKRIAAAALAMTMCFDTFPASPKASYFGIVIVTTISFSVSLRSDTAPMPAD